MSVLKAYSISTSFDPSKDYQRSAENSQAQYIRRDSQSLQVFGQDGQDFSNLRRESLQGYSQTVTYQEGFGDQSLMDLATG